VTYVCHTPGLTATTAFTAKDSFLGTTITTLHAPKTFTLFNFYSPGQAEPLAAILPTLKPPNDCILMGDLNAHHPWWQGPLLPIICILRASQAIADWLEENNFHLQNEPSIPTHHPKNRGRPSTIDLYLSRGSSTQSVLSLAVDHDTTSDHSAVTITLSLPMAPAPAVPHRYWHRADWGLFDPRVQSAGMDLSQLQGTDDTLRAITNITYLINQAVDEAVPLRVPRKVAAPWWNHSFTLAKQSVKRADRRARLQPTTANREDSHYKRSKRSIMVRNSKTAYRIHQLENASTRTVWKTLNHHNMHHKLIPPLDGRPDFQGKCDVLRKALFPDTVQQTPLPANLLTCKKDLRHYKSGITAYEIQLAITHLKYGMSVGPDNITYSTLRRLNEAAPHLLPCVFTAGLKYAVHPPEWKTANCVVILKPGKKPYSHPKSYRPISLESCFGKLLETIVAKRLSQTALMCGATHPSQMGAQPENSAIDALLRTINPIANSISRKKTTNQKPTRPAVLMHDIEGAFNQVHPTTLYEIMCQCQIPSYLVEWVVAFNTDRQITIGFDQQSEKPQPYQCGLPQGSPISPILSLIYSNAMLEKQHYPADAIDTSYVDDVCIIQLSHTVSEANVGLEERTERHLENGTPLGLRFATSKTKLLYCLPLTSKDKNRSLTSHPLLRVLGPTIPAR